MSPIVIEVCVLFERYRQGLSIESHTRVCPQNFVVAMKPDMEGMMFEMASDERQYHQKLEVGKIVSTRLHLHENYSEESLRNEYNRVLAHTSSACVCL